MTGAIIGSAVLGAAASSNAASEAADAAEAQTQAASSASAAQLAFSKEQYQDWKDTFGDISDNLSNFYNNLNEQKLASHGIQNIKATYATAVKNVDQALAQRGISSSGLQAQALVDLASQQAKAEAEVRANAPLAVAQEKMKFLSLGMGQGANAVMGVNQAYSQQANLATQQATQNTALASQAAAGIGSSLSSGLNSYMTYSAMQNQSNLLSALTSGNSALSYNTNTGGALTSAYFGG